jgi:hypothetical protein
MENPKKIEVQRLCDLDDWEFYEVAEAGAEDEPCTIGLRPYSEMRQVEYEAWARGGHGEEEPRATGSVDCESAGRAWDDAAREGVLREVITTQPLIGAAPFDLSFSLGPEDP